MRTFSVSSRVFCPICETVDGEDGSLRGLATCSAGVFINQQGNMSIGCFNCSTTSFAAATFRRSRMGVLPTEKIHFEDAGRRINSGSVPDIVVGATTRMLAISAPTGIGKSTFVKTLVQARPDATVCAISFREMLARRQAEEWALTDYKDEGAFTPKSLQETVRTQTRASKLWDVDAE